MSRIACLAAAWGLVLGGWSTLLARGGWADLPFVYVYEADDGQAEAGTGGFSALDGTWSHDNGSDAWDGSTPEPGDGAPGGAEIELLVGEGEEAGDASVLNIEDTGDPRDDGFPDPSNRKVFFLHDTSADLDLADGITLVARWRLNPEPKSDALIDGFNGTYLHDGGKGQIGFNQRVPGNGTLEANLALALTDDGTMQVAQGFGNAPCSGSFFPLERCLDNEGALFDDWVTVWLTAIEEDGAIRMKLYLDGALDPALDTDEDLPITDAPTGDEGGGSPASYIQIGLGATPQNGAIEVDYVAIAPGFNEPESFNPNCPSGLTAQGDATGVILSWSNGVSEPTGVSVTRNGEQIAAAADASAETFTDSTAPAGALSYEMAFTFADGGCPTLTTEINTCPGGLTATTLPTGVELTWQNVVSYDGLIVTRDDVALDAGLAGDATTFLDVDAPPGEHVYAVLPTTGTCPPLEVTHVNYIAPSGGDFNNEPLDWDYSLDPPPDADPAEFLLFDDIGSVADLDGFWYHNNASDSWDGSAPGEFGDPVLDPLSSSPGGVGLVTDGSVGAYLIEDVGDPRDDGWSDPSNRKVYLGYDIAQSIEEARTISLISDGVTLRARFRLTPPERAVDNTNAPDGTVPGFGGKGMIGIVHDAGLTGVGLTSQRIGMGLEVDPSGSGRLVFGEGDNLIEIVVTDPTEWLDVWMTVEDADGDEFTPELILNVYLNGSLDPTVSLEDFIPNDGGSEGGAILDPSGNLLYMGFPSTDDSGSMEVDLVCVVSGVEPPEGGIQPGPVFLRGDVDGNGILEITDVVNDLAFQFLGEFDPVCLDANDFDDNGLNEITDAVNSLGHQFLGDPPPPAPGTQTCGIDPTDDALDCEAYPDAGCAR